MRCSKEPRRRAVEIEEPYGLFAYADWRAKIRANPTDFRQLLPAGLQLRIRYNNRLAGQAGRWQDRQLCHLKSQCLRKISQAALCITPAAHNTNAVARLF